MTALLSTRKNWQRKTSASKNGVTRVLKTPECMFLLESSKVKLSIPQAALLKRLTNSPKHIRMFSHGDTSNSQMSFHFPRYLAEMEAAGYVYQEDEMWFITKLGREYLEKTNVASGEKFTTWKRDEFYDGSELKNNHTRPGCYDFLKHKSVGIGYQA